MGVFGVLSMVPDCDVLPLGLGVRDEGLLGHRGFSHTFIFAGLCAAAAGALARRWRWNPSHLAMLVFLTLASHGVLDAATTDSRGIPLLWPLVEERILAPARPIPVAPTGLAFLSHRGLAVALVETLFFLPVFILALWPPRRVKALLALRNPWLNAHLLVLAVAIGLLGGQLWLSSSAGIARIWLPTGEATITPAR
jgi:inner membrane protein